VRPVEPLPAPAQPDTRTTGNRALAFGLLVTGGVLAAGAVTAHVLAASNASIYNDDSRCLVANESRDQQCGTYRASAQTFYEVAIVGYGLAAASVATGLVFLLTSATPRSAHDGRTACGPSVGSLGVSCLGRF
jgi:hypothetical protein